MRCAHWRPVAALTALLTAGCSTMMTGEQVSVEQVPVERDVSFHLDDCSGYAVIRNDFFSSPPPVQLKPGQWREMFSRFSEPWDPENRYFRERLAYLQSHPRHMEHILKNAQPYIFHVYREVTSAGLPVEIIAIPMIESMYNPAARSPDGYSGLWQFGSTTARNFGLAVGGGRDERFDFQKSTAAAVKYLKYLMDFFDGSWTMAVAGYNAGEGRVLNTYKGTGKKPSQIDFNTLAIPEHTKKYLHTIMAYGHYLKHADRYKVRLPGEDGAGASGASAALAHPQTVIHTIRYVSREEFDRIHGLPAGALETAVRGIEKHEAGGATVCRVDMKGEFDPYPEDPVMTGEARVRPEDTDSAVGKTVSVLAGHAQGRSRGRSGGRFSVAPQDEGEFFSSLASFEGLPPASCAGEACVARVADQAPAGESGKTADAAGRDETALSDPVDGDRSAGGTAPAAPKPVAGTAGNGKGTAAKPATGSKGSSKPSGTAAKPSTGAKGSRKPSGTAAKPATGSKGSGKTSGTAAKPATGSKGSSKSSGTPAKPAAGAKGSSKPSGAAAKPSTGAKGSSKPSGIAAKPATGSKGSGKTSGTATKPATGSKGSSKTSGNAVKPTAASKGSSKTSGTAAKPATGSKGSSKPSGNAVKPTAASKGSSKTSGTAAKPADGSGTVRK